MIKITERDKKIIEFLTEIKVANTTTLSNVFFNGKTRATQLRLKALTDNGYVKYYRQNVITQNSYYVKRKPVQLKHSLILSSFIGELYKLNIEVLKIKVPLKISNIISDGFICIKHNDNVHIFLVEVENTKKFDTDKYLKLLKEETYKEKFPIMPTIIVITDKTIKVDDLLDIIHLKTDLSNMENLIMKL